MFCKVGIILLVILVVDSKALPNIKAKPNMKLFSMI